MANGRFCLASAIASASFSAIAGRQQHDFIAAFITGGIAMLVLKQIAGYRPSAFWRMRWLVWQLVS